MREALTLIVGIEADGTVVLKSPRVGVWSEAPPSGTAVVPGSRVGTLTQLGRPFPLRVPAGVAGRIVPLARHDLAIPVAYGEILVRVDAVVVAPAAGSTASGSAPTAPSGARHVASPTDGVFHGSSSPGAAPFIVPGQRIVAGQTIGLIEVMKTFNPIVYGGEAVPEEAEIVAVLVADGQEVRAGQPLVAIR